MEAPSAQTAATARSATAAAATSSPPRPSTPAGSPSARSARPSRAGSTGVQLQETRRGEGGERRRLTGEKADEEKLTAGAPPSPRPLPSPAVTSRARTPLSWIRSWTLEVRIDSGAERAGMARFHSGLGLNERRFRAGSDFKPGHFIPAGLKAIPSHYGPKRTRPKDRKCFRRSLRMMEGTDDDIPSIG